MAEHGPTICRWIGEPHDQISIAECLKRCNNRLCPIHNILKMIEKAHPDMVREYRSGLESKGKFG